jgi:hypothetical protein
MQHLQQTNPAAAAADDETLGHLLRYFLQGFLLLTCCSKPLQGNKHMHRGPVLAKQRQLRSNMPK